MDFSAFNAKGDAFQRFVQAWAGDAMAVLDLELSAMGRALKMRFFKIEEAVRCPVEGRALMGATVPIAVYFRPLPDDENCARVRFAW